MKGAIINFAPDLKRCIGYSRRAQRTIEILNELEKDGVFSKYAIGGAWALSSTPSRS